MARFISSVKFTSQQKKNLKIASKWGKHKKKCIKPQIFLREKNETICVSLLLLLVFVESAVEVANLEQDDHPDGEELLPTAGCPEDLLQRGAYVGADACRGKLGTLDLEEFGRERRDTTWNLKEHDTKKANKRKKNAKKNVNCM